MTKPKPINSCPDGGHHTFIMGACWKCGLSIRTHKAAIKERNRARWHEKKQAVKPIQTDRSASLTTN